MKYIRTKDKITTVNNFVKDEQGYFTCLRDDSGVIIGRIYIYKKDIIKESDNIEDLFDEIACEGRLVCRSCRLHKTIEMLIAEGREVYGYIWVHPDLIAQAQYVDNDWKLLHNIKIYRDII